MTNDSPLLHIVQKYFESDMIAAAQSLEKMPASEAALALSALPVELAVQAVRHLQVGFAASLLKGEEPSRFVAIVRQLEPQHAASIFMNLPHATRESMLGHLPTEIKERIREALTYPEGSIGRIMATDFLFFHQNSTVAEAIEKIRELARKRYPASYAYVVDDEHHLLGVMNMRDLMLADPHVRVDSVMRPDVFSLNSFMTREEATAELSKRRFFAAPVVDGQNRLLGIIRAEQLIAGVREEITEDIQRMFGAGGDERAFSSVGFSLRKRLPWLHVNLATAFLAAAVVAIFEDVIAKITILAVFLPVVAGQGGNAGAQSLAVVMRGIVMREIPREKVRQLIMKEFTVGALNGAIIGVVTALIAWLWHGNPFLGVVIGLGMLVNLAVAGLAGASIPVLMKAMRLDPAQCSSIILTTVTDVVGFFAFLGFAVVFQNQLV